MLLFPIGFFYACFMVASKRIAAVAAQGKCSFPWDGIGLAHKRQLRFHRAVCKTAISPERCIIAPFILKGFGTRSQRRIARTQSANQFAIQYRNRICSQVANGDFISGVLFAPLFNKIIGQLIRLRVPCQDAGFKN